MIGFFVFLYGLCMGSFLTVVAMRLPRGQSIWHGRSHCERCKRVLGVMDLIPVISFLLIGGKCRTCRTRLSVIYPLSELLTGLLFLWLYLTLLPISLPLFLFSFLVASCCIVIIGADLIYRIIPDEMVILLAGSALVYGVLFDPATVWTRIVSGVVACAFFFFFWCLSRKVVVWGWEM